MSNLGTVASDGSMSRVKSIGERYRSDFPIFSRWDISYLDSAATAQKPRAVIDAISSLYEESYANVHRSVYALGDVATNLYEEGRSKIARFINAPSRDEVIFTSGCTDSINLVAYAWGIAELKAGDEIITTVLEHHANFVPWQQLAQWRGVKLHFVGLTPEGELDLAQYQSLLSPKTKLVAVAHIANAYGTLLPLPEIVTGAHAVGARVLVDAAQSVAHGELDVQALGADFVAFSGHKLYGPNGVGVLWASRAELDRMRPFRFGGNMIQRVEFEKTTFAELPAKFEAGTPNIAGVVGLGAAVDYVNAISLPNLLKHEQVLLHQLEEGLRSISGVGVLGPRGKHHGLICFTVDKLHPHDLAQILDKEGVCVRAGHHCAQPLLTYLKLPATTRASVGVYNTEHDIERLLVGIEKAISFFKR